MMKKFNIRLDQISDTKQEAKKGKIKRKGQ